MTYTIHIQKCVRWVPRCTFKRKRIITKDITSDKAREIMDLCRMAGWEVSMFWYNWPI